MVCMWLQCNKVILQTHSCKKSTAHLPNATFVSRGVCYLLNILFLLFCYSITKRCIDHCFMYFPFFCILPCSVASIARPKIKDHRWSEGGSSLDPWNLKYVVPCHYLFVLQLQKNTSRITLYMLRPFPCH